MQSIWTKTTEIENFESLNNDIRTDVLIIGGGITGILCGYMLKSAGIDCVVAEADRIFSGTTKNTTAKITYLHGCIYDKMIKRYGLQTAKLYAEAQIDAICEYRKLSEEFPCDFKQMCSYVYSLENLNKIKKEVYALQKIGLDAKFVKDTSLPFKIQGAVCVEDQAQFNPLMLLKELAKDLRIFENTRVLEFKPAHVVTDKGKIYANKIIVATHFPLNNKHGSYFLKMYQHRSYVLALKNCDILDGMYVDESKKGMSFRNYNNMLLIGGGGHRTGKQGGNWTELLRFAKKYYPDAKEVLRWAAQDCMTLDDIPYIGQYSKSTSDLYVATGFNKWGMTSSMVSAKILKDIMLGKPNRYLSVFNPSRSIVHPQLAINGFETLTSLLTPVAPRCPHLGCALKYNPHEHSWDCKCHGSRFDEKGKVIDNPANGDLKI